MKAYFMNVKFLLLMLFFISGLLIMSFAENREKTFDVSKGNQLEVSISHGNVSVYVWSKDQVYIKAVNIDDEDLNNLKLEKMDNKVVVKFKGVDSDQFYIEVSLPTYLSTNISTGGGNIDIKGNLEGKVELASGGGNISLMNVANKLSISTGGGSIAAGNIEGEIKVSSGGGNIAIGNVKGKAEISSGGGNIAVGNVTESGEISTAGGNISVGTVSGSIKISSAGGNISLDGATGKADVNTAGGNISLKNISGSVSTNTAGGNIKADLNPSVSSNSELNTAGGDITLVLPSGAKANIIATVYARKSLNKSEAEKLIKSDFEAASVDFMGDNLVKKFVLNGGGANIELKSASGKIKIIKK